MKVGDLVKPIEPAIHKGGEFLPVLVINTRNGKFEYEIEILHSDGEAEWFPAWMMKKESN